MLKSVLHSLGFVLQTNGLFLLVPLAVAFSFGEPITPYLLASLISLGVGFVLFSIPTEKELNFQTASILIFLAFTSLAAIATVPIVMLGPFSGSVVETLTNSYFEAVSGYTTTGLSLIKDVEALPRSLIFFRSFIQWIGGINVIFLMILLVTPTIGALKAIRDVSSFEKIRPTTRATFSEILKIYLLYTVLFILLFYFIGGVDWFNSINIVFAGLSTGGFIPVNNLEKLMNPSSYPIFLALMIAGAISFLSHYSLWVRRRKAKNIEIRWYLVWTAGIVAILLLIFPLQDAKSAIFNAIAATTTAGFSIGEAISETIVPFRVFLMFLMFIGGSYFSTAGGIKFVRLILFLKSLPWVMKRAMLPREAVFPLKVGGKALFEKDVLTAILLIILGGGSIVLFSWIFSFYGFSFTHALFELTSAFTNTGLSIGITSASLPFLLKYILIFEMIIGRIEVFPFLIFLKALIRR